MYNLLNYLMKQYEVDFSEKEICHGMYLVSIVIGKLSLNLSAGAAVLYSMASVNFNIEF